MASSIFLSAEPVERLIPVPQSTGLGAGPAPDRKLEVWGRGGEDTSTEKPLLILNEHLVLQL